MLWRQQSAFHDQKIWSERLTFVGLFCGVSFYLLQQTSTMQRRSTTPFESSNSTTTTTTTTGSTTKCQQPKTRRCRKMKKPFLFGVKQLLDKMFREEEGIFVVVTAVLVCLFLALMVAIFWHLMTLLLGYSYYYYAEENDDGSYDFYTTTSTSRSLGHRQLHKADGRKQRRQQQQQHHHQHHQQHQQQQDQQDENEIHFLPYNQIYRIPEAFDYLGDRSSEYAKLRLHYDTKVLPLNEQRSLDLVRSVVQPVPVVSRRLQHHPHYHQPLTLKHNSDQVVNYGVASNNNEDDDYDIYNCPETPPRNYPRQWNLVNQVLKHWPADDTNIPSTGIHQGLCVFDYQKEYQKALRYRDAQLPFVVVNDPNVARAAERWHYPGYMEQMVGPNVQHRAEYNKNNHFMYALAPRPPQEEEQQEQQELRGRGQHEDNKKKDLVDMHGRKAELQNKQAVPEELRMTFGEWLKHANVSSDHVVSPTDEHWYFRLIACGFMDNTGKCDEGTTEALYDELTFSQPRLDNLYLGDPILTQGIHCRFGMKGVIAENHFDHGRNAIAVMYGQRRYILSHPNQCANVALLPEHHPSARHSAVDYAQPDLQTYPEFANAEGNEVVLQPGQVLFLPAYWFHYIVSLGMNYQCNTRSGNNKKHLEPIKACGFF